MSFPNDLDPEWRLTVGGSIVDWKAAMIDFDQLEAQTRDGDSSFEFHVLGESLGALPDSYSGKSVLLEADWGSGWTVLFSGRCTRVATRSQDMGWLQTYSCKGLTYLANRVPVTNPIDGTDAIYFNLASTDPNYLPALAARTVGAMLRYVLDGTTVAADLKAYGVGNYTATVGSGATATVDLFGAVTMVDGGSGYSSASPPNAVLVGGDGTYTSCTCTVGVGGDVTAVSISGFSGYTVIPEVWISCLPVATLRDFAALTLIPQASQTVQGERLFDSLKNLIHQSTNNHALHIDNDGTIRAYDLRSPWSTTTLYLDSTDDRIDLPSLSITRSVEDCFPRVKTRGGPHVVAALVSMKPNPNAPSTVTDNGLEEYFGHDGLSSDDAKPVWSLNDYTQPGLISGQATVSPSMGVGSAAGTVVGYTTGNKGYGYTSGSTYNAIFSAPTSGTTAAAHSVANSSGQLATWTITNAGSGYGSTVPSMKAPAPPGSNFDTGRITAITTGTDTTLITIQPDDHTKSWPANHYDQSDAGRHGTLFMSCDSLLPGVEIRDAGKVLANTALTAGSTCDLTIEGAHASGYNSYELFATSGGAMNVWQLYRLTSNAPYVGKLAQQFPYPFPCSSSDGSGLTMTSTALAWVLYSDDGNPPYQRATVGITIDSTAGTIRTDVPTVVLFGTHANLVLGGDKTDGIPSDIQALLPVIIGNLEAVSPADVSGSPSYAGTSNSVEGLEETYTVTIPAWIDPANQKQMDAYAADIADSVKDAILDGQISQLRFNGPLLASFGQALQLSAPLVSGTPAYPTPWDGIAVPILSATLLWNKGKGNRYTTQYHISNQREALGADYFVRPTHVGLQIGGSSTFDMTRGEIG